MAAARLPDRLQLLCSWQLTSAFPLHPFHICTMSSIRTLSNIRTLFWSFVDILRVYIPSSCCCVSSFVFNIWRYSITVLDEAMQFSLHNLENVNCIAKEDIWTMWMSVAALTAAVCGAEQHSRSNEITTFFSELITKRCNEMNGWDPSTR